MTDDAAWIEDVRRWCLAGSRSAARHADTSAEGDVMDIGYEAAHPALLARHWPDAPTHFTETV